MTYTPKLKPCPFCGSSAKFGIVPDDDLTNFGGHYIQCTNRTCEASSALIFPSKDDPRRGLAERWNRRTK